MVWSDYLCFLWSSLKANSRWGRTDKGRDRQTDRGWVSSALPSVSWVSPTDMAGAIASGGGAAGWDGMEVRDMFKTQVHFSGCAAAAVAVINPGSKKKIKIKETKQRDANRANVSHKCTCTKEDMRRGAARLVRPTHMMHECRWHPARGSRILCVVHQPWPISCYYVR